MGNRNISYTTYYEIGSGPALVKALGHIAQPAKEKDRFVMDFPNGKSATVRFAVVDSRIEYEEDELLFRIKVACPTRAIKPYFDCDLLSFPGQIRTAIRKSDNERVWLFPVDIRLLMGTKYLRAIFATEEGIPESVLLAKDSAFRALIDNVFESAHGVLGVSYCDYAGGYFEVAAEQKECADEDFDSPDPDTMDAFVERYRRR